MLSKVKSISKKVLAMALSIAVVSGFAACGNKPANSGNTGDNSSPKEISVGDAGGNFGGEMATLDPAEEYNGWYLSFYGTGETLYKLDENIKPYPVLVDSHKVVDDKTWEFKIKDNVTFHNGEKLTAERVKASFEHMLKAQKRASETYRFESINADGQTLTIKTTEPTPALLNDLCDPLSVVQFVDDSFDYSSLQPPPMTGPFKITSFVAGEKTVMEGYKNYWGGAPKLDKVNLITMADKDALTLALQSGEIDMALEVNPSSIALFSDTSKYQMHSIVSSTTRYLYFNMQGDYKDDVNLRKAVSMCIDRESTEKAGNGTLVAAYGLFSDNIEFGGTSGLNLSVTKFDLEGAKKLLEESGYKDSNGDGILDKNGKNLELQLVTSTGAEMLDYAQALQSNLKTIGVNLVINEYKSVKEATADGKKWDVAIGGRLLAPSGTFQYIANVMFVTDSSANEGGYSNPKFDALAKQLETTFDNNERIKISKDATQILFDDGYIAPFVFRKFYAVSTTKVKDFNINPSKYYLMDNKIDIEK
ncbi:MAG: ABC transporter substrate-binding protein [Clostridia bacterium]|nr:ABC transporter substrate-binding protein [Clostridia bacterium]